MPKYLLQASYKTAGAKGLLIDGGMKRRAMVEELAEGLGGKLETFYFAFGETDVFTIMDLPDDISIAAATLAINASGAVLQDNGSAIGRGDRSGDKKNC